MTNITLKTPELKNLNYRQALLADKDTMYFNAGYNLDMDNYCYQTGCVDFSPGLWENWYNQKINNQKCFYAYVLLDDSEIGEVYCSEKGELSIIIHSEHRNKGYSKQALALLLDKAFNQLNLDVLTDTIPENRIASVKLFKSFGFVEKSSCMGQKFDRTEKVLLLEKKKEF